VAAMHVGPMHLHFHDRTVFNMIVMYVNDIRVAWNNADWLVAFKAQLGAIFKIKNMGELS
jgi:hypothetical protein